MRMQKALFALSIVALIPLATGCDDNTPAAQTGDLQVTYRVGSGSTTCEDEGIVSLDVYIMSGTTIVTHQIFPCDPEDQSVMFNDLAIGTYTITANGLNADQIIIYSGAAAAPVTIVANTTNGPINIVLNQIPPALQIFVDFSDAGNCDFFEVADVRVVVYETGGGVQYDATDTCVTLTDGSVLVEDLNESATYDVRVRGANDNGEYLYEYNEDEIAVQAGQPTVVGADLVACSGICADP
jgi:hypothetical protein